MKLDWKINAYDFWFATTPKINFWITPPNDKSTIFDLFVGTFGANCTSYDSLDLAQSAALRYYEII